MQYLGYHVANKPMIVMICFTFSALPAKKEAFSTLFSLALLLASSTAPVTTSMPTAPLTCGAITRLIVPAGAFFVEKKSL